MIKTQLSKINDLSGGFCGIFLLISLSAAGLFHPFICAFACSVLFIYLFYTAVKNKKYTLNINWSSVAVGIIALFYIISTFWAVDSSEAFFGIFKFLIPFLWILILMHKGEKTKEKCLALLPFFAAFMTVISTILSFIPKTENLVEIAGRLCGFFQYSNTFALFLLVSLVICVTKEKLIKIDIAVIPILIFGIFYSGSRTVFILTAFAFAVLLIFAKNKKLKIITLAAGLTVGSIVVTVALVTENFYSIGRFLTFSFTESTFVGRLLYYTDALPVILHNPFGLGFMGYYYMQGSFATGVYSVISVHNDFLQIILDIGFIPAFLFIIALIKSFFSKKQSMRNRLLIALICIHCFFDFDLQYISMFMILVLLLKTDNGKEIEISKNTPILIFCTLITVISLYFGIAGAFSFTGNTESALKMYPFKTSDNIVILTKTDNLTEMQKTAEKIISRNEYVSIAYSALARISFSKGNIKEMIDYKEKAIETSVFSYDEYLDYANMLIYSINMYNSAGDIQSASFCAEKLISLQQRLINNSERLSYFGKLIDDQPVTQFPQDIENYIISLKHAFNL